MNDIPMFWIMLAGAIAVVVLVQRLGRKSRAGKGHQGIDVDDDLLRACRGDHAMAERLIQHELDRKPGLSRTSATLLALSRLRDDRR